MAVTMYTDLAAYSYVRNSSWQHPHDRAMSLCGCCPSRVCGGIHSRLCCVACVVIRESRIENEIKKSSKNFLKKFRKST